MTDKRKYWCMACGAYAEGPCLTLGHISKLYVATAFVGQKVTERTVIAADYLGEVRALVVKLP